MSNARKRTSVQAQENSQGSTPQERAREAMMRRAKKKEDPK